MVRMGGSVSHCRRSITVKLATERLVFSVTDMIINNNVILLLCGCVNLANSTCITVPYITPVTLNNFCSFGKVGFCRCVKGGLRFVFKGETLACMSARKRPTVGRLRTRRGRRMGGGNEGTRPRATATSSTMGGRRRFRTVGGGAEGVLLKLITIVITVTTNVTTCGTVR